MNTRYDFVIDSYSPYFVEVVAHEETGLLVNSGDSAAFAEAIVTLLTHQETVITYGRAAITRAQNIFGWARYVDAYDALYRTLGKGAMPAETRS